MRKKMLGLFGISALMFIWGCGIQDTDQSYTREHFNAPEEAVKVVEDFWDELVTPEPHNVYEDYRILTFGPSPEAGKESTFPGRRILEGDLIAWVEVRLDYPKWNYPHIKEYTIVTKRSGSWVILESLGPMETFLPDMLKRVYLPDVSNR